MTHMSYVNSKNYCYMVTQLDLLIMLIACLLYYYQCPYDMYEGVILVLKESAVGCEYGDRSTSCTELIQSASDCYANSETCCHTCLQYYTWNPGTNY